MENEWKWKGELSSSLKHFAEKLQVRRKHTFGNTFKKKRRLSLRLEGVQKVLASKPTNGLIALEARLKREWDEISVSRTFMETKIKS